MDKATAAKKALKYILGLLVVIGMAFGIDGLVNGGCVASSLTGAEVEECNGLDVKE